MEGKSNEMAKMTTELNRQSIFACVTEFGGEVVLNDTVRVKYPLNLCFERKGKGSTENDLKLCRFGG